jgi:cytolysin (calcineurin-like family phosphatase)
LRLRRPAAGLDVTFLVASDTHLGFGDPETPGRNPLATPIGIERTNLKMIRAMNGLPGHPWPRALRGQSDAGVPDPTSLVGIPRGVLVSGDLTEDGGELDWPLFTALYGLTGSEGPLRFPVYEGGGNHDRNRNWYVREQIAERHGGRFYSFDFDGLHLICLGEAPDDTGFEFLTDDLSKLHPDVPLVLYFHYPLSGPYSEGNWFGQGDYRSQLARAIEGRNVLGIFHGHYHASGAYRWRGHDVYNVGSPKHAFHSFAVVHVSDSFMKVASYDYEREAWQWWHGKPLGQPRRQPARRRREIVGVSAEADPRPRVDL